eukprot:3940558-Rhodomonas_salina.3
MAPPEPEAEFCVNMQLDKTKTPASAYTAPPYEAEFCVKVALVAWKMPPDGMLTAPPLPLAWFMLKVHPAASVTVEPT